MKLPRVVSSDIPLTGARVDQLPPVSFLLCSFGWHLQTPCLNSLFISCFATAVPKPRSWLYEQRYGANRFATKCQTLNAKLSAEATEAFGLAAAFLSLSVSGLDKLACAIRTLGAQQSKSLSARLVV